MNRSLFHKAVVAMAALTISLSGFASNNPFLYTYAEESEEEVVYVEEETIPAETESTPEEEQDDVIEYTEEGSESDPQEIINEEETVPEEEIDSDEMEEIYNETENEVSHEEETEPENTDEEFAESEQEEEAVFETFEIDSILELESLEHEEMFLAAANAAGTFYEGYAGSIKVKHQNEYYISRSPLTTSDYFYKNTSNDIVAYCYNHDYTRPNYTDIGQEDLKEHDYTSSGHTHYTRSDDIQSLFDSLVPKYRDENVSNNVIIGYDESGNEIHYDPNGRHLEQLNQLRDTLLHILYNGYSGNPTASAAMQTGLSDPAFRMVTQMAIKYITTGGTQKMNFKDIYEAVKQKDKVDYLSYFNGGYSYTSTQLTNKMQEVFDKLITLQGAEPPENKTIHIYTYLSGNTTYKTQWNNQNHPKAGTSAQSFQNLITAEFDDKVGHRVTFGKHSFGVTSNDTFLSGAQITILTESGTEVEQWTSGNEAKVVYLPAGNYIFREDAAPNGYKTVPDIHFTIDNAGRVTVNSVDGVANDKISDIVTIDSNSASFHVYDPVDVKEKAVEVRKDWSQQFLETEKVEVKIGLYKGDELIDTVTLDGIVDTKETEAWYHKWSGLDPEGDYTVREILTGNENYYPEYRKPVTTIETDTSTHPGSTVTVLTEVSSVSNGDEVIIVNRNNSNKMLGSNASLTTAAPFNDSNAVVDNSNIWVVSKVQGESYFTLKNKGTGNYLTYEYNNQNYRYILKTKSDSGKYFILNSGFRVYMSNYEAWYYLGNQESNIQVGYTSQNVDSDYRLYKIKTTYTPPTTTNTTVSKTTFTIENVKKATLVTTVEADDKKSTAENAVQIEMVSETEVQVKDTIAYTGLVKGQKYTVTGNLYEISDDGSVNAAPVATVTQELTADESDGTWTMDFGKVKLLPGKKYVVYESAVSVNNLIDSNGDRVLDQKQTVEHKDSKDLAQTIVTVEKPTVDIDVKKTWSENFDDNEKVVNVVLLKDGEDYETVELSAANDWYYKWEKMDKDSTYDVREVIPEGMENIWIPTYGSITTTVTEERKYNIESWGGGRRMTYVDDQGKTVVAAGWAVCINNNYIDPAGTKGVVNYAIRENAQYNDVLKLIQDKSYLDDDEEYMRLMRVVYYFTKNYADKNGQIGYRDAFDAFQRVVWNVTDGTKVDSFWNNSTYKQFDEFYLVSYGYRPDATVASFDAVKTNAENDLIPESDKYEISDATIRSTLKLTTLETDDIGKDMYLNEKPYQNLLFAEIVDQVVVVGEGQHFTIHNDKVVKVVLPDTGGIGTQPFVIGGVVMMMAVLILLGYQGMKLRKN